MKLLHISDLHIGKRVNEFSMLEDQKYILRQILAIRCHKTGSRLPEQYPEAGCFGVEKDMMLRYIYYGS